MSLLTFDRAGVCAARGAIRGEMLSTLDVGDSASGTLEACRNHFVAVAIEAGAPRLDFETWVHLTSTNDLSATGH